MRSGQPVQPELCHLPPPQDVQELNRVLCDKLEEKVRRAAGGGGWCGVALSVRRAPAERVCAVVVVARGSGAGRARLLFMDRYRARDSIRTRSRYFVARAISLIVARATVHDDGAPFSDRCARVTTNRR